MTAQLPQRYILSNILDDVKMITILKRLSNLKVFLVLLNNFIN